MRFWTVQPHEIWARMERGDSVRVDPDHPKYRGTRPWQYDWLAAALVRNASGFDGGWPWWLSCEAIDLDRLRSSRLPGGRRQVRIELELPEGRFVTFPLWMWETIHTDQYLARTRREFEDWLRDVRAALPDPSVRPLPEPWRTRLEATWIRMFRPEPDPRCWYHEDPLLDGDPNLQRLMKGASRGSAGLTQVLRASDVVDVIEFTASGSPR